MMHHFNILTPLVLLLKLPNVCFVVFCHILPRCTLGYNEDFRNTDDGSLIDSTNKPKKADYFKFCRHFIVFYFHRGWYQRYSRIYSTSTAEMPHSFNLSVWSHSQGRWLSNNSNVNPPVSLLDTQSNRQECECPLRLCIREGGWVKTNTDFGPGDLYLTPTDNNIDCRVCATRLSSNILPSSCVCAAQS